MHSAFTRLQNAFGFFTTVACVLAGFIAATDFLAVRKTSGTIIPTNIQVVKGRPHYYSSKKEEYAIIKFSLDADLSSLFTWNTKQLFVYVTAEWPANATTTTTTTTGTNSAVIWDSIITNPSADHLQNIGPVAMKKLRRGAEGKPVDPSRGILKLKNQRPKYQITHPTGKVAQVDNAALRLHYNVQPWVGLLTWNMDDRLGRWLPMEGGVSEPFGLPAIRSKSKSAEKAKGKGNKV